MRKDMDQAEKEGTVEPLVPWTVVGRPVDGRRTAGGRSSAARVSSAAPKKKSFDRGGPVWPPRSNVTNDRLRGGLGGLCPPSQKPGGLGGSAPQPKIFRNISKNFEKNPRDLYFTNAPLYYDISLRLFEQAPCSLNLERIARAS